MITQGIELSAEYDEKFLSEVPVKDQQVSAVAFSSIKLAYYIHSTMCDDDDTMAICKLTCETNLFGQLVYVSMGASRPQKKKDAAEYSSSLPPPPRDKLPVTLLLQPQYFEQLFSLMQSLSSIKTHDRPGVCPLYIFSYKFFFGFTQQLLQIYRDQCLIRKRRCCHAVFGTS